MSLLTKDQIAEYAFKTGRIFESMCDEPQCGKLIRPDELCIVLKWHKRLLGEPTFLGRKPRVVRCMTCENEKHPRAVVEVKIKAAGRGVKKVSVEVASTIEINPIVRKAVLRLVKREGGIEKGLLISQLMKKKAIREMSKKVVSATIRGMRKLKMFRAKQNVFVLPKQKKARKKIKV